MHKSKDLGLPFSLSNSHDKSKLQIKSKETFISNRLWILLQIFLLFGFLRVSRYTNPEGNRYYLKYISWRSLITVLIQLGLAICAYVAYTAMLTIGRDYNFNWVAQTLWLTITSRCLSMLIIGWIISNHTVNLLNGWDSIEEVYLETFGTPMEVNSLLRKVTLMYLAYFVVPVVLMTTFPLSTVAKILGKISKMEISLIFFINGVMNGGFLGVEALFFIICFIFSSILNQFYEKLRKEIKIGFGKEKLLKWKKVFILLGKQMQTLNSWLSPIGLVSNISRLIGFCAAAYLMLVLINYNGSYLISEEDLLIVAYSAFGSEFVQSLHSFLEVYYAMDIQKGYKKIIRLISEADTHHMDVDEQLEVNNLIRVINGRPTEVRFYETTTVDWGMILSVCSFSITYLIILLQFKPII